MDASKALYLSANVLWALAGPVEKKRALIQGIEFHLSSNGILATSDRSLDDLFLRGNREGGASGGHRILSFLDWISPLLGLRIHFTEKDRIRSLYLCDTYGMEFEAALHVAAAIHAGIPFFAVLKGDQNYPAPVPAIRFVDLEQYSGF